MSDDLTTAVRHAIDAWRGLAAIAADPLYDDASRQAQLAIAKRTRSTLEKPDEDDAEMMALYVDYIAALDAFIACAMPTEVLS